MLGVYGFLSASNIKVNTEVSVSFFLLSLAPQPSLGLGLLHKIRLNFVEASQQLSFLQGKVVAPRPTPMPVDQASVYIIARGRVATHFSRLLRHAWVTVGLFRLRKQTNRRSFQVHSFVIGLIIKTESLLLAYCAGVTVTSRFEESVVRFLNRWHSFHNGMVRTLTILTSLRGGTAAVFSVGVQLIIILLRNLRFSRRWRFKS
jgi:hypothetical protein